MNQAAFSGLTVLTYPELHEDSIPQINSLRAVSKMMQTCGLDDFSIKGNKKKEMEYNLSVACRSSLSHLNDLSEEYKPVQYIRALCINSVVLIFTISMHKFVVEDLFPLLILTPYL